MRFTQALAALMFCSTAAFGIPSAEGKFEYAIDAPWRIEPRTAIPCSSSTVRYCGSAYRIPIQISFHDTNHLGDDLMFLSPWGNTATGLVDLMSIEVVEEISGAPSRRRTYYPYDLHEVEYTRNDWPCATLVRGQPCMTTTFVSDHQLCRAWQGSNCDSFKRVGGKSEWHATLLYDPAVSTAGSDVRLTVTMKLTRTPDYLPPIQLRNYLKVHLGEAPLPKFDQRWAYGDLHYHSQGTDNDGESAYSYRGVLQAMAAMGLDFLFATEHASNSEQIVDLDADLEWELAFPGILGLHIALNPTIRGVRDMNQQRFQHLLDWLHASNGANAEAMSFPWSVLGLRTAPQIFLGGEVDVIPEVDNSIPGYIAYGHSSYSIADICREYPSEILKVVSFTPAEAMRGDTPCHLASQLMQPLSDDPNRFLIHDLQGKLEMNYFARQHLLHLPSDPARTSAFIPSNTSNYGGARRRLSEVARTEYGGAGKGSFFLAHPLDAATGNGAGRLGPDILPYSDIELEDAFRSPAFLGLELWNEDTRLKTKLPEDEASTFRYHMNFVDDLFNLFPWADSSGRWAEASTKNMYKVQVGAYTWDRMLLWGMDRTKLAAVPWLPSGEPRRLFMAGGSDAHGDLNYRREGAFTGASEITDTALGKPRNLVFVGLPEGSVIGNPGERAFRFSQQQVMSAIQQGRFAVTDGPALRIAIDRNGNGLIDDADTQMGGLTDAARLTAVPLIVEWKSTPEFGPVTSIDLYVGSGAWNGGQGVVYAPRSHGPQPWVSASLATATVGNGGVFTRMQDEYWLDPTGQLRILVQRSEAYTGRRIVWLRPEQFPSLIGKGVESWPTMAVAPDILYVRAFARSAGWLGNTNAVTYNRSGFAEGVSGPCDALAEQCIPRFAFTNPIWIRMQAPPLGGVDGTR